MKTVWRVTILVGGALTVVALGVFAGMVLGAKEEHKADVAASSAAGGNPADHKNTFASLKAQRLAGSAAREYREVPGASLGGKVADRFLARGGVIFDQSVGTTASNEVLGQLNPVFNTVTAGSQKVLPPFLANEVPMATEYSKVFVRQQTRLGIDSAAHIGPSPQQGPVATADGFAASAGLRAAAASGGAGAAVGQVAALVAGQPAGASGAASDDTGEAGDAAGLDMPPPGDGLMWSIELGHFAKEANADDFSAAMAREGIATRVVVDTSDTSNQVWESVRTFPLPDEDAADRFLRKLVGRGYSGKVVSEASGGGSNASP